MGAVLRAETADGLRRLVAHDYSARPVPRECRDREQGLCAYVHDGPCDLPGAEDQGPPLIEFLGEDGCAWLIEYWPNHAWAIVWGHGQNVVRAWPVETAFGDGRYVGHGRTFQSRPG